MNFIVIDSNEDYSVFAKKFTENFESREHHATPFFVTSKVFPIYNFSKPFLHHWRIDIIIISPSLVASIVGWVDKNALYLLSIERHQCFQCS